jgi:DNA-binding beta-propeller fold protein YncE
MPMVTCLSSTGIAEATMKALLAAVVLAASPAAAAEHYEYVFPDRTIFVYDEDRDFKLIQTIDVPEVVLTRGVAVDAPSGMLYISYRGAADRSDGFLLKYDLVNRREVWTKQYDAGVDSMSLTPDGSKLYMPTGTHNVYGSWFLIDTTTGDITSKIVPPGVNVAPHNTIVSPDGTHVYLGTEFGKYFFVADTATQKITQKIGPLREGIRPFTIDSRERVAYVTLTRLLGFVAIDLADRHVVTVDFGPKFSYDPATEQLSDCPSHGISLSPDDRELYVIDTANSYVHVFDVRGTPAKAPAQVADIRMNHRFEGNEPSCVAAGQKWCGREGWLQHSRDGRFVFVGDSGDVIDTKSRTVVGYLPALRDTRKHIEVTWQNGKPIGTSTRSGIGYK